MKRTILFVLLGIIGVCTSMAEDVYEMPDYYGLNTTSVRESTTFSAELGVGNQFEEGLRMQRNFNKYLSWDILGFKYGCDYTHDCGNDSYDVDGCRHELDFTTGLRAFTPKFGKSTVKLFGALDMGYGLGKGDYYREEWHYSHYGSYTTRNYISDCTHHFVVDFTIGFQFCDRFYVAYGVKGNVAGNERGQHTDYTFRLGMDF